MGVYIKSMEMPTNCEDCPMVFSVNFGILCTPTHNIVGDGEISKKQDFCPLVSVPPHGRLIDADAIPYKKIMLDEDDDEFYYGVTQPYIDRMPTIIPADEG